MHSNSTYPVELLNKLTRWRQVKGVSTFNDNFNKILLDIPDMGAKDQIDWYSRGLKPYIWKALCTKEYSSLSELMKDAERIESAYSRSDHALSSTNSRQFGGSTRTFKTSNAGQRPVPMEIGQIGIKRPHGVATTEIRKLTKEERERCMREGLCLRCRQKGHMAKDCPKGRKN